MKGNAYAYRVKTKDGKEVWVPTGMVWDEDRQCLVRPSKLKASEFKKLYKKHLRERLDQARPEAI